jgi:hypothetical protein
VLHIIGKQPPYVALYRSSPDSSYNNNYSVKGNYNPNTGKMGTRSRTQTDKSPTYNKKHYGTRGTYDY